MIPIASWVRILTHPTANRLDLSSILVLGSGLAAVFVVFALPPLVFLLDFGRTFVHEFGHTAACWFFAHPASPSFDLISGGGATMYDERSNWLLAGIIAAALLLIARYRRNRLTSALLAGATGLYVALLLTPAHEVVILLAGHGAELLVAGFLIYRVIAGGRAMGVFQRNAYAFAGLFIILQGATFSYRLLTSTGYRMMYESTEGAGFEMDFTRVAHEFLRMDVTWVALIFLACSLLVPLASYSFYRFEGRLSRVRARVGSTGVISGRAQASSREDSAGR